MTTETFSSIRVLKPEEYSETKYDFVAEMVAASNEGVSYFDVMRAIVECVGMEFDLDWEKRWFTMLNSSSQWGSKGDADGRLYEMDAIDIPAYVSDFPKSFYVGVIYPDEMGSDDELLAAGFEIEANDEQAEDLDMEFEDWMLNKYGPAWQIDTWAEVGADQEAYNEEIQREFDEFLREREEQQEQEKTDAERGWRESETRCDLFTTWMDEDGVERQGFVHDTGYEVLCDGMWLTAYEYPDGKIYPELPPV